MHRTTRRLCILACVMFVFSCSLFDSDDDESVTSLLVYVSAAGSDDNDGLSPSTPLLSIATAISLTPADGAEVRVAAGTYTMGAGLPSTAGDMITISEKTNFKLTGGWDDGFGSQSGTSVLQGPTDEEQNASDAAGNGAISCRPIVVDGCTGITISGFTVTNGYSSETAGGISFTATNGTITNCTVSGCSANSTLLVASKGGGIYVYGDGNTVSATVTGCSAARGGGVWVSGTGNVLDVTVTGCSATLGGGVIVYGSTNTVKGTLGGTADGAGNKANQGGGIYVDSNATDTTVACAILDNKACDGGGAYVGGSGGTVSGEVSGNSATDSGIIGDIGSSVRGGGIYLTGSGFTVSGDVHGNSCTYASISLISLKASACGGGLYVDGDGNTITGDVYGNGAELTNVSFITLGSSTYGGGVYASGDKLTVSGDVKDNTLTILSAACYSSGAGIYLCLADNATISSSTITGNTVSTTLSALTTTWGQGIFVEGSAGVTISGCTIGGNGCASSTSEQVWLYGKIVTLSGTSTSYPVSGLAIKDCTFYGYGSGKGYGIFENTEDTSIIDVTGQTITGNAFSSLEHLYHDADGTGTDIDTAADLNTASTTGAATASGNTLK